MKSRTVSICKSAHQASKIVEILNKDLKPKNGACIIATGPRIMHVCSDPNCQFPSPHFAGIIAGAKGMYELLLEDNAKAHSST